MPSQYTIGEFAGKIRDTYPGAYDKYNDTLLVEKFVETYPVYRDRVIFDTPPIQPTPGQTWSQGFEQQLNTLPYSPVLDRSTIVTPPETKLETKPLDMNRFAKELASYQPAPASYTEMNKEQFEAQKQYQEQARLANRSPEQKAKDEAIENFENQYHEYIMAFNALTPEELKYNAPAKNPRTGKPTGGFKSHDYIPATQEQFAQMQAGRTNSVMPGNVWWPNKDKLKKVGNWEDIGAATEALSYGLSKPIREGLGLEDKNTPYKKGLMITQNYQAKDFAEELRAKRDRGETLNSEEAEFLEDSDKNIIESFWDGFKTLPELGKMLFTDKEFAKDFLNDMGGQLPAAMVTGAGIGGAVKAGGTAAVAAGRAALTAKQALKLRKIAQNMKFIEAFKDINTVKKIRNAMTNKPGWAALVKDISVENFSDSMIEALIESSWGSDFDLNAIANEMGEGFIIDALPQSAMHAFKRISERNKQDGRYVTKEEFDTTVGKGFDVANTVMAGGNRIPGMEGNLVLDTPGEQTIATALEEVAARGDRADIIREAARRRNTDATADEKFKIHNEPIVKNLTAEQAYNTNRAGMQEIPGYRDPQSNISHIGGTGNTGTMLHESLHGLEKRMFSDNATPQMKELGEELTDWVAQAQQWAEANNKPIPSEQELIAQTFTYRLGYDEPMADAVKDIPVPDALVSKMADALGEGKNGKILRGDKIEPTPGLEYLSGINSKKERYRRQFDPGYETPPPFSLAPKNAPSMNEARATVPENTRNRLGNIWDVAQKTEGKEADRKLISIGKVSNRLNKEASKVLGKEVKAAGQYIRLKDVRHIDERHGVGKETDPKQIPVTKETFTLIPDVLENFDEIQKGSETANRDSVKLTKHYSDGRVIIADAVLEDGNLTITSMFIKSPATVRPKNAETPSGSRLSNQRFQQSTLHEASPRFTELAAQQDDSNIQNSHEPESSKGKASTLNYSSAAQLKGEYRTNLATDNIENSPSDVRFSLANTAGVPESHKDNAKATERAKELWEQKGTDSPFFKRWFGDSKVVDENGKPKVMYHGTSRGGFSEFNTYGSQYGLFGQGSYFTENKDIAQSYTNKGKGNNKQVYGVYLSIKNPLDMDAKATPEFAARFEELGVDYKDGMTNEDVYRQIEDYYGDEQYPKWEAAEAIQDGISAAGYDGITHIGGRKEGSTKHRVYIAFNPEQIKSATDNTGAFDGTNPDIRYSLAEVAEKQDFRDEHGAPTMEWDTLKEALEEGGSTNLSEVARGKHNQPKDYFDTMSRGGGPRGFMYDTPEGWQSLAAIKRIERLIAEGKNRKKLTAKVYRAVPNDVKTDELIHHDWVTLSKKYAVNHGESRFGEGEYKIIEQDVPIRYLWWDGNDINEWGYDPSNETRFSLTPKQKAESQNAPEYRVYNAVRNFLAKNGAVDTIDEAYLKYDKTLAKDKRLSKGGQSRGFHAELDKLAETLSEDPDIAHLIGDGLHAGEKAVEIASNWERLTDEQKAAKGRAARDGDSRTDEDLEAERRQWETSEEGRRAVNDEFNEELQRQIDGTLPEGHIYHIGYPGEILQQAGVPDLPIELSADRLAYKADKNNRHPFNISEIKDLPNAVNDPIAVFAYGDKTKAVNVITEIEKDGKNFLVGIALNPQVKGEKLNINSIRTVFPKDIPEWKNWIDQGKATYINKEKVKRFEANPRTPEDVTTNPTNEYNKFSEQKQEKSAESEKKGESTINSQDKETWMDTFARKVQDAFRDLKALNDIVKNKNHDAYRALDLMHGKTDYAARQMTDRFWTPIAKIISEHKLDINKVNDYLYALVAPEVNEYVRSQDPNTQDGSGVSDAKAAATIKEIEALPASKKKAFEAIAKLNRDMNKWRMDMLVEKGMWSQEKADRLAELYPNYVPLRGLSEETEAAMGITDSNRLLRSMVPKGVQVKADNKARKGRKTKADNVLAQNFAVTLDAIINAERNTAMQELWKMAEANPDPKFWELNPYYERRKNAKGEMEHDYEESRQRNVVKVYIDGEANYLKFKTEMGARIANNIKGLTEEQSNKLIRAAGKANRFIGSMVTSYSPAFIVTNLARDYQHAIAQSFVNDGPKKAVKVLKDVPLALIGLITAEAMGVKNKWSRARELYFANGGKIGYVQSLDYRQLGDKFIEEIKDFNRMNVNPKKIFHKTLGYIENINGVIENSTRIAYFQALVDDGMSPEKAAQKARDLTVNFNRKGEFKWISSWWMFGNASIQGIQNVFSKFADKDPAVRKRAIGGAAALMSAGAAMAVINRALADDEDNGRNGYDNIPEYVKQNNMVIATRTKDGRTAFETIPMPHGFKAFYNAGRLMMEMANNEHITALDFTSMMANNILNEINPFGVDISPDKLDEAIVGIVTPAGAKPFAESIKNTDFAGRNIRPKPYDDTKPDSELYFKGVNPLFRGMAGYLNEWTGGNKRNPGLIDVSPETIEHIFNGYSGGIGRIFQQTTGIIVSRMEGEEIQPRQLPVLNRFHGRTDPNADRGIYKEMQTKSKRKHLEYMDLIESGETEEAEKFLEDNYGLIMFHKMSSKTKAKLSKASKQEEKTGEKIGDGSKTESQQTASKAVKAYDRIEKLGQALKKAGSPEQKKRLKEEIDKAINSMTEGFLERDK